MMAPFQEALRQDVYEHGLAVFHNPGFAEAVQQRFKQDVKDYYVRNTFLTDVATYRRMPVFQDPLKWELTLDLPIDKVITGQRTWEEYTRMGAEAMIWHDWDVLVEDLTAETVSYEMLAGIVNRHSDALFVTTDWVFDGLFIFEDVPSWLEKRFSLVPDWYNHFVGRPDRLEYYVLMIDRDDSIEYFRNPHSSLPPVWDPEPANLTVSIRFEEQFVFQEGELHLFEVMD